MLPVFGLCVGLIDPTRPAEVKPRLPQEALLHSETYSTEQPARVATLSDLERQKGEFISAEAL